MAGHLVLLDQALDVSEDAHPRKHREAGQYTRAGQGLWEVYFFSWVELAFFSLARIC